MIMFITILLVASNICASQIDTDRKCLRIALEILARYDAEQRQIRSKYVVSEYEQQRKMRLNTATILYGAMPVPRIHGHVVFMSLDRTDPKQFVYDVYFKGDTWQRIESGE